MNQHIQKLDHLRGFSLDPVVRGIALSSMAANEDMQAIQGKMSQVVDLLERIAESQRVQTAILEGIAEDKGIKKTW